MQNGYYMQPNYHRPYPGFEGDGGPAGGEENGFNGGMPFQQPLFYPPGHPYAHGGGVGYQQMGGFNGGGFRPDGYMPEQQHPPAPPPPSSGKALNPAAAGFTFQPRKEANGVPNGRPREEVVAEPAAAASSLGLSLEPAESRAPTPAVEPAAEVKHAEVVEKVEKVEAEVVPEPEVPVEVEAPEPEWVLTFTGPTIAGLSPGGRNPRVSDPITVRPQRPSPDESGNSYAVNLSIPSFVVIHKLEGALRKRRCRESAKPMGKAVGDAGRKAQAISLTFGEITAAPILPAIVAPAATAPAPVRSWAALVGGPKSAKTPDTLSVTASSTLPSPSKSTASLPSDTGVTTPRSTDPSLPAPAARPAFNYAAAAAVGAPPTAAEDLAHLLTEGLRPRATHAPAPLVPRGLINTGNMCFANTILQVLVYCTPFTELFDELGKRLKADLARRTPLLEAMIVFLREFVPGPSKSGVATPKGKDRDEAFVPENVYDAMKENKRFDSMRRGYQEDAEEYLGFFLNTLHEELLGLYSRTAPRTIVQAATVNGSERTINRPVSPGAGGGDDDDWLEVGKKQKTHVVRQAESKESSVSRIFGGTLRSVLHTPGQKDSVTLEPYQPLQLDVQDAKVSTIADALRHLNEPETVGGVWSASRNANVDATKQVYIDSFPPVLILHLKRFVYDPQEQNVVKRDKPVAYGTELVVPQEIISASKRTPKPVTYRLFGVVYHHGHSATGGHYTVAVARPDGTGWLHFDDDTVQTVPADAVVVSEDEVRAGRAGLIGGRERCAYLLFYQRIR
jgi:ubiquitin carboxyl-terminal hydrolase 10